mmetsp:Transcript_3312/g.5018  ORF Transcript_3312/g.5018 Transcript_3312/m.5018 type:complete len:130 (+) Transcript_3312:918-1307(+)
MRCNHKVCGQHFTRDQVSGLEKEGSSVMIKMEDCQHLFHQICLQNWMKHQLKVPGLLPLSCPACRTLVSKPFVEDKVQIKDKLRDFARDQLKKERIPSEVKCPTLGCQQIFKDPDSKVMCPECSKTFCL